MNTVQELLEKYNRRLEYASIKKEEQYAKVVRRVFWENRIKILTEFIDDLKFLKSVSNE